MKWSTGTTKLVVKELRRLGFEYDRNGKGSHERWTNPAGKLIIVPRNLAKRLAREKAEAALTLARADPDLDGALIIAADTVVGVGRRCLPKAELIEEAAGCLRLLSGRSHRVYTGVTLVTAKGQMRQRLVETRVRFKRLTREDIDSYLASGEWQGKAGGYAIQGLAGGFVVRLVGSYTNVVGLPLYESVGLLQGEGFPVHFSWLSRG